MTFTDENIPPLPSTHNHSHSTSTFSSTTISVNNNTPTPTRYPSDRFIPINLNLNSFSFSTTPTIPNLKKRKDHDRHSDLAYNTFNKLLKLQLFPDFYSSPSSTPASSRYSNQNYDPPVLSFSSSPSSSHSHPTPILNTSLLSSSSTSLLHQASLQSSKFAHKFSTVAYKVLDAPELTDDFYDGNQVDWSLQRDLLMVGMGRTVYLWDPKTAKTSLLCDLALLTSTGPGGGYTSPSTLRDCVTSLKWSSPSSSTVIIGTKSGTVRLHDASTLQSISTLPPHSSRVGSLSTSSHPSIFSTGSSDKKIHTYDLRLPSSTAKILTLESHRSDVCGLAWDSSGTGCGASGVGGLLASGCNDNKLLIWDLRMLVSSSSTSDSNSQSGGRKRMKPIERFRGHQSAVKALCWSPHESGLLVSGGGTMDRKIRWWDTKRGKLLGEPVETGSQVCGLLWSRNSNEVVSTHGYSFRGGKSSNQIRIWSYPSKQSVATISAHSYRVLHYTLSPDGRTLVTGSGDETIRFWDAFGDKKKNSKKIGGIDGGVLDSLTSVR